MKRRLSMLDENRVQRDATEHDAPDCLELPTCGREMWSEYWRRSMQKREKPIAPGEVELMCARMRIIFDRLPEYVALA